MLCALPLVCGSDPAVPLNHGWHHPVLSSWVSGSVLQRRPVRLTVLDGLLISCGHYCARDFRGEPIAAVTAADVILLDRGVLGTAPDHEQRSIGIAVRYLSRV